MNEKLSSWVDGELGTEEAHRVLDTLAKGGDAIRSKCETYWLIGDSLREEPQLSHDFCDRVMAAINEEPTVLAPIASIAAPSLAQQTPSRWLSIAAAGAGVAVVGWMAYSFNKPEQVTQNVASMQNNAGSTDPTVDIKPAVAQANTALSGDHAYVVAHQPYGGAGGVVPGVATYIVQPVENEQQPEPEK